MARGDKRLDENSAEELRRRADDFPTAAAALAQLVESSGQHPLWQNPLLRACEAGHLTRSDFGFIFGQYYLYSKSFTRFISAVMANCPDDLFRAQIAENLWEEAGESDTRARHSEMFRGFLKEGLSVDIARTAYGDAAHLLVNEYMEFCLHSSPIAGSAFLGLGTEGIIRRLYSIFLTGLRRAGVSEQHLTFFKVHIEDDDDHAKTLMSLVASYFGKPGWHRTTEAAMLHALDLRHRFLTSLWQQLQQRRLEPKLGRIQGGESLVPEAPGSMVHSCTGGDALAGELLYQNVNERLGIDFKVHRLPFEAEVLDPRLVDIPPGKANEKHKHAHETLFYIVKGRGTVLIGEHERAVVTGDVIFVPRWCMHQTRNTGDEPMLVLAITDFELTRKALIGDYRKTARQSKSNNAFGLTGVLADIELDDLEGSEEG